MNNDYLWDGSGAPDPEIQKLEDSLARFRHVPARAPEFPEIDPANASPRVNVFRRLPSWIGAAAAVALAIAGWLAWRAHTVKAPVSQPTAWDVATIEGAPRVASVSSGRTSTPGKLGVGQVLETDDHSRASISMEEMGEVQIDPDTRVRLLGAASSRQRLALDRGTIHATIWATPGDFAVDTPSAIAVDLGCAYTLHVDDAGAGILRTSLGWVGFHANGHDSFIPAGAVCATRPGFGPGTPYYEDSSAAMRDALARFDFEAATDAQRDDQLAKILAESRKRDALTLWHLLSRVSDADRPRVYDRLAALVPPPAGITREGVLRLDQHALDLWWSQLGYGDISLWRTWEQSWSETKSASSTAAHSQSPAR